MSWNVRGLGKKEKRGKIKKNLRDKKVDILLLQETKQKSVDKTLLNSLWGHCEYEYLEVNSDGAAGGLLIIWSNIVFKLAEACSNRNFLLIKGTLNSSFSCAIVNVYGPCNPSDRKNLWEQLAKLKIHFSEPWCLGGDLNETKIPEERKGCIARDRGMRDLNKFIEDLEFVDLPLLGRSFTWSNSQEEEKWSRIDMFLLQHDWLDMFNFKQWGLPRSISDHCPLLLLEDDRDWGPRPFRFFNAWLENKDCLKVMEKAWIDCPKQKWAATTLSNKLKAMKEALKVWANEVFGNVQTKLTLVESELHRLDLQAEDGSISTEDRAERRVLKSEMWRLSRTIERMWMQNQG